MLRTQRLPVDIMRTSQDPRCITVRRASTLRKYSSCDGSLCVASTFSQVAPSRLTFNHIWNAKPDVSDWVSTTVRVTIPFSTNYSPHLPDHYSKQKMAVMVSTTKRRRPSTTLTINYGQRCFRLKHAFLTIWTAAMIFIPA